MGWIIEALNERDEETGDALCWSNSEGWTGGDNYDTFSEEERKTLDLPSDGIWVAVPWSANKAQELAS